MKTDLITFGTMRQPVRKPSIPDLIDINKVVLVGAGAIGKAIGFNFSSLSLTGELTIID